jgi:hypothetical protein
MKPSLLLVAAAAALLAAGVGLGATVMTAPSTAVKVTAKLAARSETPVPKGAAGATGLFVATLDGRALGWRLTFAHLTGRAVAAHIHLGKLGVAGPVAVPLCGPCVSGARGNVTVTAKVRAALLAGGAYVNVHTAKNPGGEIRGQATHAGAVSAPAGTVSTTTSTTTTDDGYGGYG